MSQLPWMKERLLEGIAVDGAAFDEMYDRFYVEKCGTLEAKTNKQENKRMIQSFLNDDGVVGTTLFFYSIEETVTEVVERKVARMPEEVKEAEATSAPPAAAAGEGEAGAEGADGGEKKGETAAEGATDGPPDADADPAAAAAAAEAEAAAKAAADAAAAKAKVEPIVEIVREEVKSVRRTCIVSLDTVPGQGEVIEGCPCMYFTKTVPGKIPADMASVVDYGVLCGGNTLLSLSHVIDDVYMDMLNVNDAKQRDDFTNS